MRGLKRRLPETRQGWVVGGFLALALALGGGGSPSPAAEILVELAFAIAVIAWLWWADRPPGPRPLPPRPVLWLAALLVGVPLVQLIPLPPQLWQALPGRETQVAALALVGEGDSWRPLSVAPARTLAGLLSIVPVAGVMLATATLTRRDRRFMALVAGAMGLAGAALGALQMAGGRGSFRLYEITHDLWLTAFHANRNSAADALLVAMLALTAWFATGSQRRPLLRGDIALLALGQAVLFVALMLTGSRAGITLVVPVLLLQFAMLRSAAIARGLSSGLAGAAGLIALLALAASALSGNPRIAEALSRFDATAIRARICGVIP